MKLFSILIILISFNSYSSHYVPEHNFSVVINNEILKIYRSKYLGTDGIEALWAKLTYLKLPHPKTVIYMNDDGYKGKVDTKTTVKNYAIQEYFEQFRYDFKFYHSYDYSYRVYVDGKNPYKPKEDIDKKNKLSDLAKEEFGEAPSDGKDGGIENFLRVLDLILDSKNSPVIFHCKAGRHRTGMVAMALRYLQNFNYYSEIIDPNDKIYRTRAEVEYLNHIGSRRKARKQNVLFIRKFIKTDTFRQYQKKYFSSLN